MKKIKFLSYFISIIWLLIALITLGSIYLSSIGWAINLGMGAIFALLALYIFFKEKNFAELLAETQNSKTAKKAVKFEIVPLLLLLFLGLVALSAVSERVFSEGFAVFG